MYRNEPEIEKIQKSFKNQNKNQYRPSSEKTVRVKVRGGNPWGEKPKVGRICE